MNTSNIRRRKADAMESGPKKWLPEPCLSTMVTRATGKDSDPGGYYALFRGGNHPRHRGGRRWLQREDSHPLRHEELGGGAVTNAPPHPRRAARRRPPALLP